MTLRLYLAIGAGAVLAVALVTGFLSLQTTVAKARSADALQERVEALEASHERLSAEAIRRAEFDSAIRAARTTVHLNLDKVTHEDPVARDYLGERIPDVVREAARTP